MTRSQLPDTTELRRRLGGVARRIRLAAGLRGITVAFSALLALVVLSLFVDRLFRLGVPARAFLLFFHVAAVGITVHIFMIRPLLAALSSRFLADLVERQRPGYRDLLRSAVAFSEESDAAPESGPVETALKHRVIEAGERLAVEIEEISVIDRKRIGQTGALGLSAALVVALIFVLAPAGTLGIWFRRNVLLASDVEWPYRTTLHVVGFEGGSKGVPRGDPLDIDVEVEGEMPTRAWIYLEYENDGRRFPLTFVGERRFRYSHPEVREPFSFRVVGGDYGSGRFRVEVLERPRLESLTIVQVFPDYMGLEPVSAPGNVGELSIPVGTQLDVAARSTKALRSVTARYLETPSAWALDSADPRRFSGSLRPTKSGALELSFVDTQGVEPDRPTRIGIHLVPDRKPTVKLHARGIGAMVSERARIPLIVDASDDHRVMRVMIAHESRRERPRPGEAEANSGDDAPAGSPDASAPEVKGRSVLAGIEPDTPIHAEPVFEVSEHDIHAESRLGLQGLAEDGDTLNGPNIGASGVLEFLVVTDQKLMDDFLRRQAEQHQSFKRLIQSERKVRDTLYEDMDSGLRRNELAREIIDRLLSDARQQRAIATQSLAIASALEQILAEMTNNRVGEADDLQRLGQKVIEPLQSLAETDLPALSSGFDGLRREEKAVDRVTKSLDLADSMEETLQKMDAILASMAKLEGYTEIVNQLRAVIGIQGQSREAVQAAYEKLLRSVFDDDFFDEGKGGDGKPGGGKKGGGSSGKSEGGKSEGHGER